MSKKIKIVTFFAIFLFQNTISADAKEKPVERPAIFQKLVDCKLIVESNARLVCYDTQVEALDSAEKSEDIVVVDKQQIKKANRGLFGLSVPKIGTLFGKDDKKENDIDEIETVINTARSGPDGNWSFVLEDGARWVQIDGKSFNGAKKGDIIKIRKASMGSYLANVGKSAAIRIKRLN